MQLVLPVVINLLKLGTMRQLCVIFLAVWCWVSVCAVDYSRADEGLSHGYLSSCPGSWKPAVIKPKTLERITISVMGPKATGAKLTRYNYYNIRKLAKHPSMDFRKKTFLYVSGYLDSNSIPIGSEYGAAFRALGYNVLLMEAVELTARDYPVAVRYMRPVGLHVAEMLANLTQLGLDPKKLELVGLSLGGQTMSFVAKNYRRITGRSISALTALDPAGPCFRHLGPDQRLDVSDADFVMTVVTNMNGFGMGVPVGNVTFYVNGGEYQPGEIPGLPCTVLCSHIRSLFLWTAALQNPHKFIGVQCDSLQHAKDGDCFDRKPMVTNTMDMYTDRSKQGIFYLRTSSRYPYFLAENGLLKKTPQF